MDSPAARAATASAVGALTEFLAEQDAGTPRGMADYLQQLIAAEQEGVTPRELLGRIGLAAATDPE